jgi:acyl carrier protein
MIPVKEKVIEILNSVNNKIGSDYERDLLKNGIIDSFEIVNIVMELENGFDVVIDPELIIPCNFKSIKAICEMIEKLT